MAEIRKRKTRMYEPWGYQDENNYQSSETQFEIDLNELFASAAYNSNDKQIHFFNNDGKELSGSSIDTTQFSASVVEEAYYDVATKELVIKFANGDEVRINMAEIVDENEFADGLQVIEGQVSVKRNAESDDYFTIDADGIKIAGIKADIDTEEARAASAETALDEKIDAETARATSAETALDTKINKEITDRTADVDEEEARATGEERRIETKLDDEITRAKRIEQALNSELDSEEVAREAGDAALSLRITTEVNDRIAAVNAEKARAEVAEAALNDKIDAEISNREAADSVISGAVDTLSTNLSNEVQRAKDEEEAINERIDDLISGGSIDKLDELIEKLGYKDNDTLQTTNEHEVAFGEWNISSTSADASGQTVFSIGIGTSESDRKNAFEVRKDGSLWATVEGEYLDITKILGQLTHEVYDADTNGNH